MRRYFLLPALTLFTAALSSPCLALEVTLSSTTHAVIQGEPIYVWFDYYNDTADEVGVAIRSMFGTDVLTIRNQDGEILKCAFEVERRGLRGRNQIRRIGSKEHRVSLVNLLGTFDLKEAGTYTIQVSADNHAPELDLDKDHPLLPASKLVTGRIESNRLEFTITAGSGIAFELAAQDKRWGLFGLHYNADQIAKDYPESPYAPYAMMEQVDRLLYAEGSGPEPLQNRLVSARARIRALRSGYSSWQGINIALIQYAERLIKLNETDAAVKLLKEVQRQEHNEVARRYVNQLLVQARGTG